MTSRVIDTVMEGKHDTVNRAKTQALAAQTEAPPSWPCWLDFRKSRFARKSPVYIHYIYRDMWGCVY